MACLYGQPGCPTPTPIPIAASAAKQDDLYLGALGAIVLAAVVWISGRR